MLKTILNYLNHHVVHTKDNKYIKQFLKTYAPNTLKIPSAISLFVTTTLKKNKNTFELLFICPLILGLITSAVNDHTLNKFTAFILSYLFIFIFLGICILFLILSYRITIQQITNYKKDDFENLKKEIINNSPLTITKKSVIFSFTSFLFSSIMVYVTFYRIAFVFIFLGGFFLLRDIPLIKNWLTTLNLRNSEITKKFHDNYLKFYEFNKYCKWICFIYFIYFYIFCLDHEILLNIDSINTTLNKIIQSLEPLYLMLLVFINSILMDLFFEFVIMFSDGGLILTTYGTLARRISKAVIIGGGGGGLAAASVSYSPLVELPGVNESQIRFGRGYGYKTPLDWGKGNVLNSYFDKSTVKDLAKKYGTKNILDGNSYNSMLNNEPHIRSHLNETATPMEQRIMGLRKF